MAQQREFIDIITQLTAIAGFSLPEEAGYIKLGDSDAQGFIKIARGLLPKVEAVRDSHDDLLKALKEIAEGKGRYSMNKLTHCENTVEDMVAIATAAIAKTTQ